MLFFKEMLPFCLLKLCIKVVVVYLFCQNGLNKVLIYLFFDRFCWRFRYLERIFFRPLLDQSPRSADSMDPPVRNRSIARGTDFNWIYLLFTKCVVDYVVSICATISNISQFSVIISPDEPLLSFNLTPPFNSSRS